MAAGADTFLVVETASKTLFGFNTPDGNVTVPENVTVCAVVAAGLNPTGAPQVTFAVLGSPAGSTTMSTVAGKFHVPAVACA